MKCGCGCAQKDLTDDQKKILKALADADAPCGSKDIAAATGLEAKAIGSRVTAMKKKGMIDSPVRCKYAITAEGRALVG